MKIIACPDSSGVQTLCNIVKARGRELNVKIKIGQLYESTVTQKHNIKKVLL
jgi:hypothetical protein